MSVNNVVGETFEAEKLELETTIENEFNDIKADHMKTSTPLVWNISYHIKQNFLIFLTALCQSHDVETTKVTWKSSHASKFI